MADETVSLKFRISTEGVASVVTAKVAIDSLTDSNGKLTASGAEVARVTGISAASLEKHLIAARNTAVEVDKLGVALGKAGGEFAHLSSIINGPGTGGGSGGGGQGGFLTQFQRNFRGLQSNIPVLGGLITGLGNVMAGIPAPAFVPALAALGVAALVLAAPMAVLISNLAAVATVLGGMIIALSSAVVLLGALAGGALAAAGALALFLGPIALIGVLLGTMQQSQADAAKSAADGLATAQEAYDRAAASVVKAQQATVAASNSGAIATAQQALDSANAQVAAARAALAANPDSVGLQGGLATVLAEQQKATNALTTAQQAGASSATTLKDAQGALAIAARKLADAHDAVAQTNQALASGNGSFKQLTDGIERMKETLVKAATPALEEINAALVKLLPEVTELGLGVVRWFGDVIGPTLKAMTTPGGPFDTLVTFLKRAGGSYADFVTEMLKRTPQLSDIFRQFTVRVGDAFDGLLHNLIRLVDWFIRNQPELSKIGNQIAAALGGGVQHAADSISNFVTWLSANWPKIGPVFERTITIVGQWLDKFLKWFEDLATWLADPANFDRAVRQATDFMNGLGNALNGAASAINAFMTVVNAPAFVEVTKRLGDLANIWHQLPAASQFGLVGSAVEAYNTIAARDAAYADAQRSGLKVADRPAYQTGGVVSGPPGPDRVLTRLTAGEGVLTTAAMSRIGAGGLAALNNGGGLGGNASGLLASILESLRTLEAKSLGSVAITSNQPVDHRKVVNAINFFSSAKRI
jgi:hypothetical protein